MMKCICSIEKIHNIQLSNRALQLKTELAPTNRHQLECYLWNDGRAKAGGINIVQALTVSQSIPSPVRVICNAVVVRYPDRSRSCHNKDEQPG